MDPVIRIVLSPDENAKVTPFELLKDFADATPRWVYMEHASRHYAEEKGAPALVLRRRIEAAVYVDLAFANTSPDTDLLELVILDVPGSDPRLSREDRNQTIESFLDALHDHLQDRPDHVSLHVERGTVDPSTPSA